MRDIAPVATISRNTFVMLVHPSVPAKTVPEFIAYAKANPGKINVASAGTGGAGHVFGELFKMMTDINTVHVPYRGAAPALADLLAGQVQAYFVPTAGSIEYIRAGQVRALAVTTATRSEALPDIPTVGEFVPGYEASGWFGVGAPKATPAAIVQKLNKEINAGLVDPTIKARLSDLGSPALAGSPADFGKLIADETEKWGKVVKFANIKAE
jgi:tripartite-type tricarboxylate transporter receptor subunit TctC